MPAYPNRAIRVLLMSASFSPDGTTTRNCIFDTTAKIWDLTFLERFFTRESTLPQAILLNAIYEIVIIRALVKKWGQRAFNQAASVYNQIDNWSDKALSLPGEENSIHTVMKLYYLILISIHTCVSIIEAYQL